MTISLSDYEKGDKFKGDYDQALAALQDRLAQIQAAYIMHNRTAVIMFEGWDAAGKGGIITRMTADLDPRYYDVWPIGAPSPEEKVRHFLWRFWKRLPGKGEIGIFDRSWYGRVLVEPIEGFCTPDEARRGYDEINEFESQLVQNGTTLIKLFIHITQAEQDERFADRLNDPWKRWKTGADDYRNRSKRAAYLDHYRRMFDQTDTRWAPWTVIDNNNKKAGRIAALTHIVTQLEKGVPMTPLPPDPEVLALAHAAFGFVLDEKAADE